MSEIPKRLQSLGDTLRELFLTSGNECAFPGCNRRLFERKKGFVGQICHIEAAMPGGERFNSSQTNEERRKASNLILLCYDHHVETNNVQAFPVEKLKEMKREHEKAFSDVVGKMLFEVRDWSLMTEVIYPKNLRCFEGAFDWSFTEEERKDSIGELTRLADRLVQLPIPSRQLLCVMVKRGHRDGPISDLVVSVPEIKQATQLSEQELSECFSILDQRGFTIDAGEGNFGEQMVGILPLESQWAVWNDLKDFSDHESIDLSTVIISLDFGILDEKEG